MTEQELKNWEQRLTEERREILERERANKVEKEAIEQAKKKLANTADVDRWDYLFNQINAKPKLVVEVQHQPEIRRESYSNLIPGILFSSMVGTIAAIIAAVLLMTH